MSNSLNDLKNKKFIKVSTLSMPNKKLGINLATQKKANAKVIKHKQVIIKKKANQCIEENCLKISNFNIPTETKGLYCFSHKKENMIDIKHKKCIEKNCLKRPTYNLPTETKALYCSDHKGENMINLITKNKCIEKNCVKHPSFNLFGKTNALYCVDHKKENMINIKSKNCIEENCSKTPNFNVPTETNGLYCFDHKKENMIDIKHKKCIGENCYKIPNFNFPKETKALYCFDHKKEDMIDIKNKKCIEKNCLKQPNFNIPTENKALYCVDHKKENMIDVKTKKCIEKNCFKIPNFNNPIETKGLYCFEHKKEDMINVKDKNCQHKKCKQLALYGVPNKKAQFCSDHKQQNMVNIILESKCSLSDCNEEYDNIIDNIKYCLKHCPDKDVKFITKKICQYCDARTESTYTCKNCIKIQNKKEWAIVRYLRKVIDTKFEYNSSKMLQGCSKKRPDVFFELNKHCVIVEIDENQHNTYEDVCECARLNEIVSGIGGRSVIIIRYNPDIVRNKDIKLDIKKADRVDLLVKTIKEELVKDYDEFIVKIIQIYYDDDYEKYEPIKVENITDIICV